MNMPNDQKHSAATSVAPTTPVQRALVSSVVLVLSACNGRLAVVDDTVDVGGTGGMGGVGGTAGSYPGPGGSAGTGTGGGSVGETATCQDGIRNGHETDIDCGGPNCAACGVDQGCAFKADCDSAFCEQATCRSATCDDNVRDGDEAGIDCGGSSCAPCPSRFCDCARSDSLMAFGCDEPSGTSIFGAGAVSDDGGAIAFYRCADFAECNDVLHWSAATGMRTLPSPYGGANPAGISPDGQLVLVSPNLSLGGEVQIHDMSGSPTSTGLMPGPVRFSRSGSVVGLTRSATGGSTLARWSQAAGLEILSALPFDSAELTATKADASLITGTGWGGGQQNPFRWSEAGGLDLSFDGLPANADRAYITAVSQDGSAYAGVTLGHDIEIPFIDVAISAFHWTAENGFVELGEANRDIGPAILMSDDGSVVSGSLALMDGRQSTAFRWTEASGVVHLTPGIHSYVSQMSADGSVILFESVGMNRPYSSTFIWTAEHGTRELIPTVAAAGIDVTGWTLYASFLSRDGKFAVGTGTCGDVEVAYRLALPQ